MFGHPHICTPPYICMPLPYVYMPQGCTHPHRPPMLFCAPAWFWSICMFWGVVLCLNVCWDTSLTPPLFGGASPLITAPHTLLLVSCALLFSGILPSYVGLSPSIEGFVGVPHHLVVWGAHQLYSCPHAHSCTFFVVHYVSHFDHGSNYYSSSYSGIFWPVISVINDSGSFPDRVSSKPWHGSITTLDAQGLWRCSWLSFCAAAANSIFNASSGLCQLCYGFSTGRFLFQS